MTRCMRHPHSSRASAEKCWAKTMRSRSRSDRPVLGPWRWYSPPVLVPGHVGVFVWGGRL